MNKEYENKVDYFIGIAFTSLKIIQKTIDSVHYSSKYKIQITPDSIEMFYQRITQQLHEYYLKIPFYGNNIIKHGIRNFINHEIHYPEFVYGSASQEFKFNIELFWDMFYPELRFPDEKIVEKINNLEE